MDAIYTEIRHGLKIDIFQDQDCCDSPAEWDASGGFMDHNGQYLMAEVLK